MPVSNFILAVYIVLCLDDENFVLLAPCVRFRFFYLSWVIEWPPIGKIAALSAYDMFS